MKIPNLKSIQKVFDNAYFELSEEFIDAFAENDLQIYSVLSGLNKESFSISTEDEATGNFNYSIIYIINESNKIKGFLLNLKPFLKNRNELVILFCKYISNYYQKDLLETKRLVNSFQHLQRMLFESKGYITFGDELSQENIDKYSLLVKGNKLPLYVPYISDNIEKKSDNNFNFKNASINKSKHRNYVYIMLNKSNGYYKIGRSINPIYREKTLQAEEPDVVLIKKWIASAEIEKTLHLKYKLKRIRGEWFALEDKDLEEINSFMLQIINKKKDCN